MTDAAADFVADLASRLAAQGFPRMPAAVLMALVATADGRASARDLTDRLGVSAAALSGAVRYLGVLGFVRTIAEPGSRRHVYALTDQSWYTESMTHPERYAELAGVLEQHAARADEPAVATRIGETAAFFRFLEDRMPRLLEEWRAARGPTV